MHCTDIGKCRTVLFHAPLPAAWRPRRPQQRSFAFSKHQTLPATALDIPGRRQVREDGHGRDCSDGEAPRNVNPCGNSPATLSGRRLHDLRCDGDNEVRLMTDRERAALAAEIASAVAVAAAPHVCDCSQPPAVSGTAMGWNGLRRRLDLAFQRPDASNSDFEQFLSLAGAGGFRSVCVPPRWTAKAVRALADRPTGVSSIVGFPNGASLTPVKCAEAECLLRLGADELWMVADIGGLRSGDLDAVFVDIRAVAELAQCRDAPLNVVLEIPLLTRRQKVEACVVAKLAGAAAAVSTSGVAGSSTDAADIDLMRRTIGGEVEIVAAGGLESADEAQRILDSGAARICTSATPELFNSLAHASHRWS